MERGMIRKHARKGAEAEFCTFSFCLPSLPFFFPPLPMPSPSWNLATHFATGLMSAGFLLSLCYLIGKAV